MRPTYETTADLQNERQVINAINERWQTKSSKLPRAYSLDYMLTKEGRVCAFVEIKCRTVSSGKYDTYMISLAKVLKARTLGREVGVPSLLAVRWTDMVGYVDLRWIEIDVHVGFRVDRNDAQDIEPVCMIPIEKFIRLSA